MGLQRSNLNSRLMSGYNYSLFVRKSLGSVMGQMQRSFTKTDPGPHRSFLDYMIIGSLSLLEWGGP